MRPVLDNRAARHLFLHRHALSEAPSGPGKGDDLLDLITRLGFVQLDSIKTVERAHHMILRARRMGYRPSNLTPLLHRDRALFEHWTHDAAIIPTAFYGHWKLKMQRDADGLRSRWKEWRRAGFEEKFAEVSARIAAQGALCSADVGEDEKRGSGGWWDWHPSKTALEYLWRKGDLSVCHRRDFRKYYDLTERVLDDSITGPSFSENESINWFCRNAMDRLGFATSGEIAAFWDVVSPAEAKEWTARQTDLIEIDVTGAAGKMRRCWAREDVFDLVPEPPKRLRILSPFDPALRDRKRAEWLFGFYYRIEIFVPEAKRQYGYYVFPILEGDRLVGRIDAKAKRADGTLVVQGLWWEPGVRTSSARTERLSADLNRLARFAGLNEVTWQGEA